jgi:hypothetical protein
MAYWFYATARVLTLLSFSLHTNRTIFTIAKSTSLRSINPSKGEANRLSNKRADLFEPYGDP